MTIDEKKRIGIMSRVWRNSQVPVVSQTELGKACGVYQMGISIMERGINRISVKNVVKVKEYIEMKGGGNG